MVCFILLAVAELMSLLYRDATIRYNYDTKGVTSYYLSIYEVFVKVALQFGTRRRSFDAELRFLEQNVRVALDELDHAKKVLDTIICIVAEIMPNENIMLFNPETRQREMFNICAMLIQGRKCLDRISCGLPPNFPSDPTPASCSSEHPDSLISDSGDGNVSPLSPCDFTSCALSPIFPSAPTPASCSSQHSDSMMSDLGDGNVSPLSAYDFTSCAEDQSELDGIPMSLFDEIKFENGASTAPLPALLYVSDPNVVCLFG